MEVRFRNLTGQRVIFFERYIYWIQLLAYLSH